MNNKSLGQYGEQIAADFLRGKGYRILEKNFKSRLGEIDVIARDGAVLVFVEVKIRKSLARGMPYESVHLYKQRKIIRLAQSFLNYRFGTVDVLCRFDVVSIYKPPAGVEKVEHIINAFEVNV